MVFDRQTYQSTAPKTQDDPEDDGLNYHLNRWSDDGNPHHEGMDDEASTPGI